MKRRWIIRIIFMLPVLLCVAGWAWSGNHTCWLWQDFGQSYFGVGTHNGILWLGKSPPPYVSHVVGYFHTSWRLLPAKSAVTPPEHAIAGFAWQNDQGFVVFEIPYWFLTLIFAAALFLVWRKTGKAKPMRAFPIEMATKSIEA